MAAASRRYAALLAAVTAVTLSAGLAACGSVPYPAATAAYPAGGRALAVSSARRLLASMILPAGSRRLPSSQLPAPLRQAFGGIAMGADSVDLVRLYQLPLPMPSAVGFLTGHPARGTVLGDLSNPAMGMEVDFTPRHPVAGLFQTGLINSVVPGPGQTSLLRVDAEATWSPSRSAAEDLVAARYKSVSITATGFRAARRSGGQRLIRPLAAAIDALPALPSIVMSCPGPIETYRLAFQPAAAGQAEAVVTLAGCLTALVTIGHRAQPALENAGRLDALVASLVGLKLP